MSTMFCQKCDQRAAIRMRQHRLMFCRDHYLEWFVEQTQRTIERYHMFTLADRLLLAVSGGKDSLALWDVLWRLGYSVDGMSINLGIDGEEHYSNESEQYCRTFAEERGLSLQVVNVKQSFGQTVPELARLRHRSRSKPCSACGMAKRHIMNQAARDGGYDVLLTAHNLDDEVAVLFANTLSWNVDGLNRQSPVLEARDGFVRKAKPFCRFYERETAAYTLLRGIEYIEEECPFATGSKQIIYKEILNKLEEEHPGIKLHYYVSFLKARQQQVFQPGAAEKVSELELRPCPSCGQPTTNQGLCAFCTLVSKAQATK